MEPLRRKECEEKRKKIKWIANSVLISSPDSAESLMMQLFLDFALTEALKNNTLQPYTTEMSEAASKLIEGVEYKDLK